MPDKAVILRRDDRLITRSTMHSHFYGNHLVACLGTLFEKRTGRDVGSR